MNSLNKELKKMSTASILTVPAELDHSQCYLIISF